MVLLDEGTKGWERVLGGWDEHCSPVLLQAEHWSSHSSWLCSLEPVHGINRLAFAEQFTESLGFSWPVLSQKFRNQTHHQPDEGSGQVLVGIIIDQLRLRKLSKRHHIFQNHLSLFLHSMFAPIRYPPHQVPTIRCVDVIPAEVHKYTVVLRTTTVTHLWGSLGPKKFPWSVPWVSWQKH